MRRIIYTVRALVESNLGWFHRTRETLGEDAGRERAININKEVMDAWFGGNVSGLAVDVMTRYFSGPMADEIVQDHRTIRNQGGGKNWRLAGDAIKGDHYDVRVGDFLFMAFDPEARILAFIVIKKGGYSNRVVSSAEAAVHSELASIFGAFSGSMAIVPSDKALEAIERLEKTLYPRVRELMLQFKELSDEWSAAIQKVNFVDPSQTHRRLLTSLLAKRFVILTGLSGSGKSLLARTFITWASKSADNYCFVAVGANWTTNESVLGYPDAFDETKYIKTGITDLLLRANSNPDDPYFLLLDEMNLSHVERYFSDFLSAIESSDQPIVFHGGDKARSGVPPALSNLPSNVFILGTVNVDETTYMFSPKVLDRANVIEFRADAQSVVSFFETDHSSSTVVGQGALVAPTLIKGSEMPLGGSSLRSDIKSVVKSEIELLFDILASEDIEFGYRLVKEVVRYICFSDAVSAPSDQAASHVCLRAALDEAVVQKVLPRIHGSRKRVEGVLRKILAYCSFEREWSSSGLSNIGALKDTITSLPSTAPSATLGSILLPLSHAKATRMLKRATQDGFVSFAEG